MASQDLMTLIKEAGFTGAAANTMYGIVMAESGGNATSHNTNAGTGDNSYGLAQINMLGSMGPARLKEFGLSDANQLFDPLTNLKVAYKLSGGGQNFTPWTTFTSGAYKNAAPGAVVNNTGSSEAGVQALSDNPAETEQNQLKAGASDFYNLATQVPELKGILDNAVKTGQSTQDFQNAIENTNWYKQNSDTVRQQIVLQASDPAQYAAQMAQQVALIQQQAHQLGVPISSTTAASLAKQSLYQGWTSATIQQQLGAQWKGHGAYTGQAATEYGQIQQLASNYGLPMTTATANAWTQKLLMGTDTIDGFTQYAKTVASSMYPSLAKQINAGVDVKTIADPYVQTKANLLEVDPSTINWSQDPTIKKALQGVGATATGAEPTATPLWQFEQQVKQDPKWGMTVNAHQAVSSTLMDLGKQWGFEAS